jgi:signal transduction histidine kinase
VEHGNDAITALTRMLRDLVGTDPAAWQPLAAPPELADLVAAIHTLVSEQKRLAHEQLEAERLDLMRDERERISRLLNDLVVRRIFALGLAIQRVGLREPVVSEALQPLVVETDSIIREARGLVFRTENP